MMQKIIPFMWFENKCEEAMNFYVSIFPNSRVVSIKKYPENMQVGPNPNMQGKVLTAVFELMGQRFMALDGGPQFKPSGAISFLVECDTQEELDSYWNKLIEGGDPNAQQCGWVQDKYGFMWQIIPKKMGELLGSSDTEKANRALIAMLGMKKIDLAELERAYNG